MGQTQLSYATQHDVSESSEFELLETSLDFVIFQQRIFNVELAEWNYPRQL